MTRTFGASRHPRSRRAARALVSAFLAAMPFAMPARAANDVNGTMRTIKLNGGWCWFEDNRIIMDGSKMLVGTIAGLTARGATAGDAQVTTYDFSNNAASTFTLAAAFERDDHDSPVFLKRTDGKYLAVYQKHGADRLMRWRVSTTAGSASAWDTEKTATANSVDTNGNTYANVFQLSAENNKIYNFTRGVGYDTNYMVSTDNGNTFSYGGRLTTWVNPDNSGPGRPYVRYASNSVDRIWLTTTDDHPRDYANSLYAGYVKGGNVYKSDGTVIAPLSTNSNSSVAPNSFTRIFQGDAANVAWTIDLKLDTAGNPYSIFQVRKSGGTDIRYHYARFNGSTWSEREIAYAGTYLYAAENDYSGLASLDPNDPNTVFISTNADPKTGAALVSAADSKRHWEIFQGKTTDGGVTWSWAAVTSNSTVDNIRPVVPVSTLPDQRVLTWLRGTYSTYTNYDMDVVAIVQPVPEPAAPVVALIAAGMACVRRRSRGR